VIGFGGGSPMDSAKVIAHLAGENEQPLGTLYGVGLAKGPKLPLLLIPTTSRKALSQIAYMLTAYC